MTSQVNSTKSTKKNQYEFFLNYSKKKQKDHFQLIALGQHNIDTKTLIPKLDKYTKEKKTTGKYP